MGEVLRSLVKVVRALTRERLLVVLQKEEEETALTIAAMVGFLTLEIFAQFENMFFENTSANVLELISLISAPAANAF